MFKPTGPLPFGVSFLPYMPCLQLLYVRRMRLKMMYDNIHKKHSAAKPHWFGEVLCVTMIMGTSAAKRPPAMNANVSNVARMPVSSFLISSRHPTTAATKHNSVFFMNASTHYNEV